MSLRPEVLDALLAAGATAEMIVAAVKADARQEKIRLQERRAKDAARQRKSRSSRAKSHDVTVTPRDATDAPPNEYISNPPEKSPSPLGDAPFSENPKPELGSEPQAVVDAWNAMAKRAGLSTLRAFNADRRKALKSRLAEHGLPVLLEAIGTIERSDFCRGQNDRNWRADFDFLLDTKKLVRVLEGKYGPVSTTPAKPSTPLPPEKQAEMIELARLKDTLPASEWQRRSRELFAQSERPQRTSDPPLPSYIKTAASNLRA